VKERMSKGPGGMPGFLAHAHLTLVWVVYWLRR
jgi:hypothetical protein